MAGLTLPLSVMTLGRGVVDVFPRRAPDAESFDAFCGGPGSGVFGPCPTGVKEGAPAPEKTATAGDRPRFEGERTAAALAEHGKRVAEAHDADPDIQALRGRLEKAESDASAASARAKSAKTNGEWDKAVGEKEGHVAEAAKVKDALAHESRRSLLLGFGLYGGQARLQADRVSGSSQAKAWEGAEQYLGQLAAEDGPGHQRVEVRATRGRAFYNNFGGIRLTKSDGPEVAAHEFGHHLEREPWVRAKVAAFHAGRFKDADAVNMSERFSHHGYDKDEVGNPDDMGKVFAEPAHAAYVGKRYAGGATEVVSMGVEKLYSDPVHFAKADPQYFGLIMSVLQEKRR